MTIALLLAWLLLQIVVAVLCHKLQGANKSSTQYRITDVLCNYIWVIGGACGAMSFILMDTVTLGWLASGGFWNYCLFSVSVGFSLFISAFMFLIGCFFWSDLLDVIFKNKDWGEYVKSKNYIIIVCEIVVILLCMFVGLVLA